MMRLRYHRPLWFFLACSLVVVLAACGSPSSPGGGSGNTGGAIPGATQISSQPGAQPTTPKPPSQPPTTACPAAGSGRAAVMNALALGRGQALVYVYKVSAATWHLRRYSVGSGQKTDIYTTAAGQIEDAQVSANGQWVIFLLDFYPAMRTDASAKIQMIRVDGQDLQTLYCFPTNENYSRLISGNVGTGTLPVTLQLSPNQQALLFSVDTGEQQSTVYDQDMTSGQTQVVYQVAADANYTTSVVTWLDNNNAYLITQGRSQPAPPSTVRLLNIPAALSSANNATTTVLQGGGRMREFSLDTSFDGAKLYSGNCLLAGSPFQTTIAVEPAHGGTAQTIYQPPASICIDAIRVISPTTLLMLVTDDNTSTLVIQHEVWTMNVNGTAQHGLTTLAPNDSRFQMNPNSQYVWSNVSRDGSLYALQQETNQNIENLVYGPVNGGNVTTLANGSSNTLILVGWTTM